LRFPKATGAPARRDDHHHVVRDVDDDHDHDDYDDHGLDGLGFGGK
jgi:hypothetical protein